MRRCTVDLNGWILTVTTGGGVSTEINRMDKGFNKIAALNTKEKLKNATIAADHGATKPLVPPGTSDKDLETIAGQMSNLSDAYRGLGGSRSRRWPVPFRSPRQLCCPTRSDQSAMASRLRRAISSAG